MWKKIPKIILCKKFYYINLHIFDLSKYSSNFFLKVIVVLISFYENDFFTRDGIPVRSAVNDYLSKLDNRDRQECILPKLAQNGYLRTLTGISA